MMKPIARITFALGIAALLSSSVAAEMVMPQKVVSNGGRTAQSESHMILATIGQSCTGVVSGSACTHDIGYWYQSHHPYHPASDVNESDGGLPAAYSLGRCQPNPLGAAATLHFALPKATQVALKLYDVSGREVKTLVEGRLEAGRHRTALSAAGLPAGIYFARMTAGRFAQTEKLVLLR